MMKRTLSLALVMVALLFTGMGFNSDVRIAEVWSTSGGLKVPESVLYDGADDILYVSNINGKPTEKNQKGFISRLSADGKMDTLKWVGGMHAPKGMGLYGNLLYVTDIDRIHVIDKTHARILKTHAVADAKFLNDIAIDAGGLVYITDMAAKKVMIIKDDTVDTWIELNDFTKPNGLFMDAPDLLVGTADGLLRIGLTTRAIQMEIPVRGGIDGLKKIGEGEYIVSDWKGKTRLIGRDREPRVLLDTTESKINAADLEYIPGKQWLVIPTFFDNRVVAYRLTR
ncbi:SMP-30/gluconolactonase/LRE family protein [Desulfosarcina alkanivorans]|nr:ATP/GTP-binding protein [Desulfosarcina alkanivorans]